MKKTLLSIAVTLLVALNALWAQNAPSNAPYRRYFVGSTLFVLANLNTRDNNRPDFAQLNFGYRITPKNAVSVEIKTWKYAWPLGIPYGKSFEAPEEKFPGYIREYGIALVYQRFWWKGLYTSVHAFNGLQHYVDDNHRKIKNGYQLFMTYRLGYHVPLFKNRFFMEPSIAVTHRPLDAHMPEAFAEKNDKWPKFFFGEPGLHFGFKF